MDTFDPDMPCRVHWSQRPAHRMEPSVGFDVPRARVEIGWTGWMLQRHGQDACAWSSHHRDCSKRNVGHQGRCSLPAPSADISS